MIRKQIYLKEEQDKKLHLESAKLRIGVSDLIRQAIDFYFEKSRKDKDWKNDPLTKAVGSIQLNAADASSNHDKYLYG